LISAQVRFLKYSCASTPAQEEESADSLLISTYHFNYTPDIGSLTLSTSLTISVRQKETCETYSSFDRYEKPVKKDIGVQASEKKY